MEAQPSLQALLFGPNGLQMFCMMMFFLLIGALIRKIIRLQQRKPSSASSPRKFYINYWLRDNWADMAIGFLIAVVVVRFPFMYLEPVASRLFPSIPPEELLLAGSVVVGYGIDKVSEYLATKWKLKA